MKRAKFKLGFRNKSLTDKIEICRRLAKGIAIVPVAKRPYVNVAQLAEQLAAAETALAELSAHRRQGMALTRRCHKAVAKLCLTATGCAGGYSATSGTAADFAAAGLDTIAPARRTQPPPAPNAFRSIPTRDTGEVSLRWKRSLRRSVFLLQYTQDPSAAKGWTHLQTICRTHVQISGLKSGELYWFRLIAQNGAGPSAPTQPLQVRAA
jgi:hypothetical protein